MANEDAESLKTRFAADRMLGRLARLLRLLGYDTTYSPGVTPQALRECAQREGRTILTRGDLTVRFPAAAKILSVKSDDPAEQLREVVGHFRLDTRSGLFTRCTLCNGLLREVAKAEVEPEIPPKVFAVYDDFFRCSDCRHVYWRGSHVERILKKLEALLGETDDTGGTVTHHPDCGGLTE
jgi:uncharacterized protein with PIN domain